MQAPIDVVRQFVDECWGEGRISLVHSLIHPDYVANESLFGPEAVIANIQAYRSAFPDLAVKITECVVQENSVAMLIELRGTHLHRWMGIEATGRPFTFSEAAFWTVRDGKIIRGQFVAQALSLRIQLGQIPAEVWSGVLLTKQEEV